MSAYTISTTKGSHTGTLREVCAWQAEMQGGRASIAVDPYNDFDVDGVDFDADDLDATVEAVEAVIFAI